MYICAFVIDVSSVTKQKNELLSIDALSDIHGWLNLHATVAPNDKHFNDSKCEPRN